MFVDESDDYDDDNVQLLIDCQYGANTNRPTRQNNPLRHTALRVKCILCILYTVNTLQVKCILQGVFCEHIASKMHTEHTEHSEDFRRIADTES